MTYSDFMNVLEIQKCYGKHSVSKSNNNDIDKNEYR